MVIKLSTPYDAAYVNEENAGIAIPSFCAAIRITDNDKMDAMYLTAFLNSSYVRDELTAKVVAMPERDDIDYPVEEHLIVEFYSK